MHVSSMFVLLRGRSKDQAFRIGQEIAEAVTRSNPKPVKLKLEKVMKGLNYRELSVVLLISLFYPTTFQSWSHSLATVL